MVLSCQGITKDYGNRTILDGVSFQAQAGSLTCIVGPSGCGKSTLLAILGGLDASYEGAVIADDLDLATATNADLDAYRQHEVGFIFQDFNLIEHMTALDNVRTALELDGISHESSAAIAQAALARMGLEDKETSFPSQLSGGEAQRIAIARAIAKRPSIILADEPTGSLDELSALEIARALRMLADEGACVIVVSHDTHLFAPISDEIVELASWQTSSDEADESSFEGNGSCARQANDGVVDRDDCIAASKRVVEPKKPRLGLVARMAFSHMGTRKKRVIGAALVCSVGILGFGLLLSLLFGSFDFMHTMEAKILSNVPITITRDLSVRPHNSSAVSEARDSQELHGDASLDDFIQQSMLPNSGSSLLNIAEILRGEQLRTEGILSVQAIYPLTNDLYARTSDGWRFVDRWTLYEDVMTSTSGSGAVAESLIAKLPDAKSTFRPLVSSDANALNGKYELIGGRMPTANDEVLIVTRPDGTIGDLLLALLGCIDVTALLEAEEGEAAPKQDVTANSHPAVSVSVDELLALDLAILQACDYRVLNGDLWTNAWYERSLLDQAIVQGMSLKVVGVAAPRYAMEGGYDAGYVGYLPDLMDALAEHANESPVVAAQIASPETNVETGGSISQEHDLIERVLSKVDYSDLSNEKLEYLRSLSNARVRALLKSRGIDEGLATQADIEKIEEALESIKGSRYKQLVTTVESIAPISMDNGIGAVLTQFDAYGPEGITAVHVYVDSFDGWDAVVRKVEDFSNERRAAGYLGVNVEYSGDVELFKQTVQIMTLVAVAFALLSILVVLVTIGSTMSTFVVERTREIGCLRSLGMSKRHIGLLFVCEALAIGAIALIIATALVILAVAVLNSQVVQISGDVSIFKLDALTFLAMLSGSLVLCALAGIIPARSAARKDPIAALRAVSDTDS